jgi:CubicO group peptidase (beta-lactamase class C family)
MVNPEISAFLQSRIDANDFPSAVYLVAQNGKIRFQDALGHAVVVPERIPATLDTIYDLASLTKVLVTGLLAAMLIEEGRLSPFESFYNYLDAVQRRDQLTIFVQDLLTHTSGFRAWVPFYLLRVSERVDILAEILKTPLNKGGDPVVYSDLNFLTLMFIIERIHGKPIDEIAKSLIFEPLGLKDTLFAPPIELRPRIAASEYGNNYERHMCVVGGYLHAVDSVANPDTLRCPEAALRDDLIWGEVHDGNAHYMNGIAGHAGLFGTTEDVFQIAMQFLPRYTSLLKSETCKLFSTNSTRGMNEHRSYGFQLASTPHSTAGSLMSPQSFGHLGFTGTSLWIDPVRERIFVLLTNRTHNHPLPFTNINSVRRGFHDLAIESLDQN